MTYRVKYTDGTKSPIIVQDGDVDTSTNLGLVGRGYTGFGEVVAENFLHLLENFSDETPPARPTEGQLWYNNTNSSMYYYTVAETWKKVGNVRVESFDPILNDGEVNGDVWLNSTTNDFYVYNSPNWVLMANGDISTKVYTRTRKDNATPIVNHKTTEIVVANKVVAIFSSDLTPWTPNSTGSNAEYLDDGSIMANIYGTIKLGINLINRSSIAEVTVSTSNPTTGTTSVYVQEGDMWVNKTTNRLYTYTAGAWHRINNYTKVRSSAPVIENDEKVGDIWIDTILDKIYYYNPTTSAWEQLTNNTTFSATSPTINDIKNIGDFWIDTTKRQLFSYNGTNWVNLSFQEEGTFVISKDRLDSNGVSHKTLETIVNGITITITSGDNTRWSPNVSEILYEGGSVFSRFNFISPGINMSSNIGESVITITQGNYPSSTEYGILKDYSKTELLRFRVYNSSGQWITPSLVTKSETQPTTPTPTKYDVWIKTSNYEIKVYNGSTWVLPPSIKYAGSTTLTTQYLPKMFNGISTRRVISGSFLSSFSTFTAGTTYTNGTIDGTTVDSAGYNQVNIEYKQWVPIIKGTVTLDLDLTSSNGYGIKISRRPLNDNFEPLDDLPVYERSKSIAVATTQVNNITIPFIDVVGVNLPQYYSINELLNSIYYVVQIKKLGSGAVTCSNIAISLETLYLGNAYAVDLNPDDFMIDFGY